jgi:hypothetical protein
MNDNENNPGIAPNNNLNQTLTPLQPTQQPVNSLSRTTTPPVDNQPLNTPLIEPKPAKNPLKFIIIGIIALAVIGGLAFGIMALLGNKNDSDNSGVTNDENSSQSSDKSAVQYAFNNDYRFVERGTKIDERYYDGDFIVKSWDDLALIFTGTVMFTENFNGHKTVTSSDLIQINAGMPVFDFTDEYKLAPFKGAVTDVSKLSYSDQTTYWEGHTDYPNKYFTFPDDFNKKFDLVISISIDKENVNALGYIPLEIKLGDEIIQTLKITKEQIKNNELLD